MDHLNRQPIQDIVGILFEVQKNPRGDFTDRINTVWDEARKVYSRETLQHEFLPVIKQIWKLTHTQSN